MIKVLLKTKEGFKMEMALEEFRPVIHIVKRPRITINDILHPDESSPIVEKMEFVYSYAIDEIYVYEEV